MSMRVERTVAAVTWRLLMGRRRWLLALLANLLPPLIAWIFVVQSSGAGDIRTQFYIQLMATLVLTVLLPLSGLVHGTSAFGAELDDGTLRYIMAKPVARWRLVVAKFAAAFAASVASCLPGVIAAGLILLTPDGASLITGFGVAVLIASALYAAVFLLLSLATRRALILGLLYVIVWEGALSRVFVGTRVLSVREYAMTVAGRISGLTEGLFSTALPITAALPLAAAMLVLTMFAAVRRLQVLEVSEEV